MNPERLKKILQQLKKGDLDVDQAMDDLKNLPFEDLDFATIDHHRSLRQGYPEVIYGEGKTASQIAEIMDSLIRAEENILVTRISKEAADFVLNKHPKAVYNETACTVTLVKKPAVVEGRGKIMVISAGTSDGRVAEEAVVTAKILGHETDQLKDVGVAGLHRLLSQAKRLDGAGVYIVVAGMEGALPSVIGGLVDKPVIAVPTSVGYGASFGGVTALLAMLNSCASGVAVVNIDNGFGAGYLAAMINKK